MGRRGRQRRGVGPVRDETILPVTSGCVQHLIAAKGITLDSVTGRVSDWADQVGSIDATQSLDANQPSYTAADSSFNDRPSVSGDGIAYYMRQDGVAAIVNGTNTPFYYIVAQKFGSVGTDQAVMACGAGTHLLCRQSSSAYVLRMQGTGLTNITGGTVDTAAHVVEYYHDGTNNTVAVDGTVVAGPTVNAAGAMTHTVSSIFGWWNVSSLLNPANVAIPDLALFDRLPTAAERSTLRSHYGLLYGITVA